VWKHLFIIVIILLISVIYATPVMAVDPDSDVVTITASGYSSIAPILFVTWVTDTEVQLDWIKSFNTANVTIRVKTGSAPVDRTDGYLVCTSNSTSFTDTGINLDDIITYVYYRAWGQDNGGVWEETGSIGYVGGEWMLELADIFENLTSTNASNASAILAIVAIIAAIFLLAIWAFKSRYPVAFMLLSGVSLISGFRWYDAFGTTEALAFSLALIVFSFCMAGTALYTMLSAPRESKE